ncbi:hypothetical protein Hdeb2414_s0021g00570181 [Helianthus debilis subsp. tardiflorus]
MPLSSRRRLNLRDKLRHLTKGSSSVSDFAKKFKYICDQLVAVGQPVDEADKTHWILCGLVSNFETFSTAIQASKPTPPFRDLLVQTESHKLFLQSLHGSTPPPVAFSSYTNRNPKNNRGRGNRFTRGGGSQSRARGRGGRGPHYQLCRVDRHYANNCRNLSEFA